MKSESIIPLGAITRNYYRSGRLPSETLLLTFFARIHVRNLRQSRSRLTFIGASGQGRNVEVTRVANQEQASGALFSLQLNFFYYGGHLSSLSHSFTARPRELWIR